MEPRWESGEPVIVTGLEAVKGWAWRAIDTARYRYPCFSWSYGCELENLIGQPYQAETKKSEAERYVDRRLEALQSTPPAGRRAYIIKDVRLFLNSVDAGSG